MLFSNFCFSQEGNKVKTDTTETKQLEEIVITTATRTKKKAEELPMPVTVVSKLEIQSINSVRLSTLLAEQVGIVTVPDFGGGEGVQVQGLDSQYTLILIDGFPLIGRSAGTLNLNRVSVGNVKRMEIVKGASSSLYGSAALGGVINIITETPTYGFKANVDNRVSSFGTYDNSLSLSYKKEKLGVNLFVNRFSTEGYDLDNDPTFQIVDPYTAYTFNTKLSYQFNDHADLYVTARYFNQTADAVYSEFEKGDNITNEFSLGTRFTYKHSTNYEGVFELYASKYKVEEDIYNINDGSLAFGSFFDEVLIRPEYRGTLKLGYKKELVFGLGLTHESLDRTYFTETPKFNAPFLFAQYDFEPLKDLNVIVGARYDIHNEYESQLSPKLAANYKINDKISLKGSFGAGYKAPDFRQLYFDFTNNAAGAGYTVLGYNMVTSVLPQMQEDGLISSIVVPLSNFEGELKTESSLNYNLGVHFKVTPKLNFNVNFFRNDVQDLIDTQVVARKNSGQNVFSYYNVHEFYTQGIEVNSTWKATNRLKFTGGYQYLIAKDKEAERAFKNGEVYANLPGSPTFQLQEDDYFGIYNRSKHTANFKVFYKVPEWNLDTNLRAIYRSKYGLYDSNNNSYLDVYDEFVDGHVRFNYAVNKHFKHFRLGLGVDNILDYTDINITNNPGRTFYASLNFEF